MDYNSPSTTGSLDLIPEANANGSSIIYLTVKDNGGVENGGVDSVKVSFNVEVLGINDAPNSFTAQGEYLLNILDGSGSFLSTEYLFITDPEGCPEILQESPPMTQMACKPEFYNLLDKYLK